MLPENNTYGPWPLSGEPERPFPPLFWVSLTASSISGEIDIMESRGNSPAYPAQYVEPSRFTVPLSETIFTEASTTCEDH